MMAERPVVLVGIDAAEAELVEALSADGRLPVLAALRERGCFGRLDSSAADFAGGVWPSFYTGREVPWHGIYHNKLWRHERMRCEVAHHAWLPEAPFWDDLSRQGYRVAAIDVPMTVAPPRLEGGVQLAGWGTHDLIARGSWPESLWGRLRSELGRPLMPPEAFGPQNARTLAALREALLRATDQMAALGASLLAREPWDLFLMVFGAAHRGGHYLWDLSQIDAERLPARTRALLEGALVDVYRACDRALGRVLEQAPDGARVLVFALHGMGRNSGWADRCADLLTAIQSAGEGAPPKQGLVYRVKKLIPWTLARRITALLPKGVLERLVGIWSRSMFDWASTRVFPLPMDHAGYLRVNLKGREPQGIVEQGEAYQALCREIGDAFTELRDGASGQPIVESVRTLGELAPPGAPYRDLLPDLVVRWADVPATACDEVRTPGGRSARWSEARKLPSGRSGNHRPRGWYLGMGDGIAAGSGRPGRTLDLVPTVLDWLGAEGRADLQGEPIPGLRGAGSGESGQVRSRR